LLRQVLPQGLLLELQFQKLPPFLVLPLLLLQQGQQGQQGLQ